MDCIESFAYDRTFCLSTSTSWKVIPVFDKSEKKIIINRTFGNVQKCHFWNQLPMLILNWKCFPSKIFVQYLFKHVGHVRDVWTNVRQRRGWQLSAADKDWGFVSPSAGGAVADPDLHVRPIIHAKHQEHRGTVSQQSILKLSDKSSLKQY